MGVPGKLEGLEDDVSQCERGPWNSGMGCPRVNRGWGGVRGDAGIGAYDSGMVFPGDSGIGCLKGLRDGSLGLGGGGVPGGGDSGMAGSGDGSIPGDAAMGA